MKFITFQKNNWQLGEMAEQAKVFTIKPDDLSLITGDHPGEGEN